MTRTATLLQNTKSEKKGRPSAWFQNAREAELGKKGIMVWALKDDGATKICGLKLTNDCVLFYSGARPRKLRRKLSWHDFAELLNKA